MNQYGQFAQQAWQINAPKQYAEIPDPESWFEELGERAENQVGDLYMQIAGPDPQGETYLEKVGRLNASRMQAEEIVRAQMLTPEIIEEDEDDQEIDDAGDEIDSTAILLGFRQEMNRTVREMGEELNRLEAEHDL